MAKIFQTVIRRIVSGAVNYLFTLRPAYKLTTYLSAVLASLKPAYKIVQITYSYLGLYGANTSAGTTGNWTNPNNALGNKGGSTATYASLAGATLAVRSGDLILGYAAVTGKTAFAITKIELVFNATQSVPLLLPNDHVTYSLKVGGGAYAVLFSSSNANYTHNNFAIDVTTAFPGGYADLGTAVVKIAGSLNNNLTPGYIRVYSVELRVTTSPITQAA